MIDEPQEPGAIEAIEATEAAEATEATEATRSQDQKKHAKKKCQKKYPSIYKLQEAVYLGVSGCIVG